MSAVTFLFTLLALRLVVMDVNDFKIKKWQWILYIVVSAGLLYITESWLMSLGILLLLILVDRLLAEFERKKRGDNNEMF